MVQYYTGLCPLEDCPKRRMLMKHSLVLILFSSLVAFNSAVKKRKLITVARILKFNECPEYEYPQVKFSWFKLDNQGRGSEVIDTNLSVLNDLPESLKILGAGYKCTTMADEGCELFLRGTVDGCKAFMDTGKFYSKLFEYKPPLKCPIKKGEYILRNATYIGPELERFVKFMPPEYYQHYWYIKIKILEGKPPYKVLHCTENMFKLIKIREK